MTYKLTQLNFNITLRAKYQLSLSLMIVTCIFFLCGDIVQIKCRPTRTTSHTKERILWNVAALFLSMQWRGLDFWYNTVTFVSKWWHAYDNLRHNHGLAGSQLSQFNHCTSQIKCFVNSKILRMRSKNVRCFIRMIYLGFEKGIIPVFILYRIINKRIVNL